MGTAVPFGVGGSVVGTGVGVSGGFGTEPRHPVTATARQQMIQKLMIAGEVFI